MTPGLWIGSGGMLGWICHVIAALTAYSRALKKNRNTVPRSLDGATQAPAAVQATSTASR